MLGTREAAYTRSLWAAAVNSEHLVAAMLFSASGLPPPRNFYVSTIRMLSDK